MSQAAEKRGGIPAMLKDTAFVWEDPLDLESELTEEERMVRNSTRGFAQSYLMPRVVEAFRDEKYDPNLLPEMGKLGLLGPTIPEEYESSDSFVFDNQTVIVTVPYIQDNDQLPDGWYQGWVKLVAEII